MSHAPSAWPSLCELPIQQLPQVRIAPQTKASAVFDEEGGRALGIKKDD
jgi:hypothetical protein